ncbi:MAG TPA: CARDB domain-containing protein, partial [Thermomicrobiales bacterium]|nr:CARDB domain-containing protein [Thermomicrobiales bacterium]
VRFNAVLRNIGTGATLSTNTAVTFELVPKAGGPVIRAGFGIQAASIGPGGTLALSATRGGALGTGQWLAVKGDYLLRVIADDVNRVPEANSTNNTYTVALTVAN